MLIWLEWLLIDQTKIDCCITYFYLLTLGNTLFCNLLLALKRADC